MKRFKQYLKEVAWTESLSVMIFDLPRAGLKDLKIPLSPAIFKRIWPESVRSKCFHVTGFDGVRSLKKMQGKKKSISAFYNIKSASIEDGIQTDGGFVVEMMADILVAAPDDIGSQPDKTGRRWLVWSTILKELGGGSKIKKMEKDLEKLLVEILVKNDLGPYKKGLTTRELNRAWIYLGKSTGGKIKSIIIKDYIDGMEKIMKKYSKPLQSIFKDYTKKRTLDPDEDSGDTELWDELVVNNVKIEKVHVATSDEEGEWDETDFDLPLTQWEDSGDLTDYIARTVSKIKL
jgi:hypothetical protein